MKKLLLNTLAICLLLMSCEKNQDPIELKATPGSKGQAVRFNVSTLSSTFEKLATTSSTSASLSDKIDNLYYLVYSSEDGSNPEIKRIKYSSSDENFGSILDTLPKGNYTVVLVGVKGDVMINGDEEFDEPTKLDLFEGARFELMHASSPQFKAYDTFFARTTVTVGDESVNSSLVLERAVAGLSIQLKDAIPADAARIKLLLSNESYIFNFAEEQAQETFSDFEESFIIEEDQKGQSGYTIDKYILNTVSPINITMICYDADENVIAQKTVTDVQLEKNRRLVLSGKLFDGGIATSALGVSVNSSWKADSAQEF